MKLLDRIAISRLVKTITDFILALLKILKPSTPSVIIDPKKKRRPLKDLLDRWRT